MSDLLTVIDYKRLKEIERIQNQYFKEMPTGHEFNKLNKNLLKEAYKKSEFVIIPLIVASILIGFITRLPFFTIALLCFSFYYGYNYNKIADEYLQNDNSSPLTKEFFLEKLKEADLEVIPDEIKRYNIFLDPSITRFVTDTTMFHLEHECILTNVTRTNSRQKNCSSPLSYSNMTANF